jgi:hypothetical protein
MCLSRPHEKSQENQMNKYLIRYNTQHADSDLVWRIFENGSEHLVRAFVITVPIYSESSQDNGIQKWNVACTGVMKIVDNIAYIESA